MPSVRLLALLPLTASRTLPSTQESGKLLGGIWRAEVETKDIDTEDSQTAHSDHPEVKLKVNKPLPPPGYSDSIQQAPRPLIMCVQPRDQTSEEDF